MGRSQRSDTATRLVEDERRWSLLTAHAHVLLCIAQDPDTRVREIAASVGISERGAHQIVADLVGAGYVRRARIGRRNRYAIEAKTTLKNTPVPHRRVASIVELLEPEPARSERSAAPRRSATRTRLSSPGDGAAPKSAKRRAA